MMRKKPPFRYDPRLIELLKRRPELRGIGISNLLEEMWSQ